jgi:hypothetical protein
MTADLIASIDRLSLRRLRFRQGARTDVLLGPRRVLAFWEDDIRSLLLDSLFQ